MATGNITYWLFFRELSILRMTVADQMLSLVEHVSPSVSQPSVESINHVFWYMNYIYIYIWDRWRWLCEMPLFYGLLMGTHGILCGPSHPRWQWRELKNKTSFRHRAIGIWTSALEVWLTALLFGHGDAIGDYEFGDIARTVHIYIYIYI